MSLSKGQLESRPLRSESFARYCEALRVAQQNPDQVARAYLYSKAWVEMYPESEPVFRSGGFFIN